MDDITNKLDDKCIALRNLLFEAKGALDSYKYLTLNASEIDRNYQAFFWLIQRWAVRIYTINICMICELEKDYPLNSIPGIIKFICENNMTLKGNSAINDFISRNTTLVGTACKGEIEKVESIVGNYFKNNQSAFYEFRNARHKVFSHSESEFKLTSLPSYDTMERVLFFCIEVHRVIMSAYLNVVAHLIVNDNRFISSAVKLLEGIGVKDVKSCFDDDIIKNK